MPANKAIRPGLLASLRSIVMEPAAAQQRQQKPNILVIVGGDVGCWNISVYNRGMMGYRTPNMTASRARARSSPAITASNRIQLFVHHR